MELESLFSVAEGVASHIWFCLTDRAESTRTEVPGSWSSCCPFPSVYFVVTVISLSLRYSVKFLNKLLGHIFALHLGCLDEEVLDNSTWCFLYYFNLILLVSSPIENNLITLN